MLKTNSKSGSGASPSTTSAATSTTPSGSRGNRTRATRSAAATRERDDPWAEEEARYIRPEEKLASDIQQERNDLLERRLTALESKYEELRRTRYKVRR